MPVLLQRLNGTGQIQQVSCPLPPPALDHPTLLQRMGDFEYSKNSNKSSNHSEAAKSLKRLRSPLSSESLGRTLMSRFLNPKRIRRSTPISQKSSPFSPPSTSQEETMNPERRMTPMFQSPRKETRDLRKPNQTKMMMKTNQAKDNASTRQICPGSLLMSLPLPIATPVAKKPVGFSKPTTKTSLKLSSSSKLLHPHLLESHPHSGNESSKEIPSTSTKSLLRSTMLSLMKREQATWVMRKSLSASLKQRSEYLVFEGPVRSGLWASRGLDRD
jgi:hypothetical protein